MDRFERKRLENAERYNKGFNAGYEAGKKHQKEEDDKEKDDKEKDDREKEDWMRCK